MSKMNLMRNLFQLSAGNKAHGKTQGARRRRLFIEDLEARRVLATLYVDINDPGCDNTGGAPFCDIQAAIDAASDGDKIKVSRGTYTENINLNKDVYLRARSRVTIDGGGTGSVLEITASGSKVKGFRITNGEDGVVLDGVNGVVVKANRIYDNTDNGVELIDADDNEFEDNDVYDNLNNGFVVDGDSDGNTFEDNEAENNVFGFQVFGNNNTFEDNEAEDNSASGFSVLGNGNTFEDNEAEDNLQNGFDVFGNSNMFEDNEAEDNALIGFAVFGNDNTFEDNEAEDNFAGFAVFGDNNTFEDSEAEDNASSGFSDMGTGNSFEDNDDDDNGDDDGGTLTIAQLVVSSATTDTGEFSSLLGALSAAGLLGTVNTAQDLTVFAPVNAAFEALVTANPGIIGDLLSDPQGALAEILLYHVATPAQDGAALVAAGSADTLLGPSIVVTMPGSDVILNGSTTVIVPNIQASNGIVHAIDMVLLPPTP